MPHRRLLNKSGNILGHTFIHFLFIEKRYHATLIMQNRTFLTAGLCPERKSDTQSVTQARGTIPELTSMMFVILTFQDLGL